MIVEVEKFINDRHGPRVPCVRMLLECDHPGCHRQMTFKASAGNQAVDRLKRFFMCEDHR